MAARAGAQAWVRRMPMVPRPRVGYELVVAAAVLFAVNGSVSKVVLAAGLSAQRLTELRAAGASLGLGLVLLVVASGRLRIGWRDLPFLGVVCGALQPWLYLEAIGHLPVSIALLLQYTAPVFLAAWVCFVLGRPLRRRFWAALGLSPAGLALVVQVWQGMALDPVGVAAGFGAAVGVASYYLLGEHGLAARDPCRSPAGCSCLGHCSGDSCCPGGPSTRRHWRIPPR